MNNPRSLASKLIATSKLAPLCKICLGAGYHWVPIPPYNIPVLCDCVLRTRAVTMSEIVTPSLSSNEESKKFSMDIPISDAIPSRKELGHIVEMISKQVKLRGTKEGILCYKLSKESENFIAETAADAFLSGEYNDELHRRILKEAEKEGENAG